MMDKTLQFIERAQLVHGDKYVYDKVKYIHSMQKVTITCNLHGDFQVTPNGHISTSRCGCQKCSRRHRPSLTELVTLAIAVHGNTFDYSRVNYVNNKEKIEIICKKHGSFMQTPRDHIHQRAGCPKCANTTAGSYHKKDTNWFISTAQNIHNNKYDYSKVNYQRYHTKVEIICLEHGSFFQTAGGHIHNKNGCPVCSHTDREGGYGEKRFLTHPELKKKPGMLYLVECWNNTERFVKIGITGHSLQHRFHKTNTIPYAYKELMSIHGTLYHMFKIEQQIKKKFKQYKHHPHIKFNGYTECFTEECTTHLLDSINIMQET